MTVPTVERGLREVVFWSIEIAGESPSIESTSGFSIWPEELARVRGQRLDVAALALGVDRVEGEARLARAGQPGDHDERVARQHDVDVAQVVLARAGDDDCLSLVHISKSMWPFERLSGCPGGTPQSADFRR